MSSARVPVSPQRRHLLGALAAAGLLTAGERLGLIRAALANGANPVPPGLHRLKGAVTINGQPAREGLLLKPGDTVVTGGRRGALRHRPGRLPPARIDHRALRRRSGGLHARRQRQDPLGLRQGTTQHRVSTATIGIRGTACYIEQPEKGGAGATAPTYFCLCYGEARVIPTAAPQQWETVITSHHDHPLYLHDDKNMPTMMVAAPVINHTDAELVMLENLVGRCRRSTASPAKATVAS